MSEPTSDQLRDLLALQELDGRIRRVQHQLDNLEEQQRYDEVAARVADLQSTLDELSIERDKAASEQRRLEGDVDLLRQRLEAEQQRMYGGEIVNPRELQSLRSEVDSTTRRVTEHEDDLLVVMERVDEYETQHAAVEGERRELADQLAELGALRDAVAGDLLAQQAELEVERDREREKVPGDLLERYDAVASKAGGRAAVGELDGGMCTACRIELPVAEVNELLDGPPLTTCPNCRRLLVTRL